MTQFLYSYDGDRMEFLINIAVGAIVAEDLRERTGKSMFDNLVLEREVTHEIGATIKLVELECDGVDCVVVIACDDIGENGPMVGVFGLDEFKRAVVGELGRPENSGEESVVAANRIREAIEKIY